MLIEVNNIKKSFGSTKAVDGLSFQVGAGEIIGLLGPNGAGKSTTMRLLTGYISPDEGQIQVAGEDILVNPTLAQHKIGYLPENNPLYMDALVSEMLDLSADMHGLVGAARRSALDFVVPAVGLDDYYYRPIVELSKGYKQRVGLALALLHNPQILILDEPTEGLDPNQRTEIRKLIQQLSVERTILMSTHVMQEVAAVCSRIIIINHGELVADGTSAELMELAQGGKVIEFEIEGNGVADKLGNLELIKQLEVIAEQNGRVRMQAMLSGEVPVQPRLSELARQHSWVIWHMAEQKYDLEDVFHKITQEGGSKDDD